MYTEKQELADWKLRAIKRMFREDRIMANMKMSPSDRMLLIKMERLWPELLLGKTVQIQVWYLAKEAGVSRSSATRFLSAMYCGGYFAYNSFLKSQLNDGHLEYTRECFVKELESCKHADSIKTIEAEKRKRDRKKAMERIKCKVCGSENMLFKLTLVCRDCGLEQE